MKNTFIILVVAIAQLFFASCHKCYQCHNERAVCRKQRYDTTLTILVSSQNLSQQYYNEYIDSLTSPSLGWVCNDTTSNYSVQYCGNGLANEEAAGFICN